MNTAQKAWKVTEGYKTKTSAILYLLFELFKTLFPDVLDTSNEAIIKHSIDLLILIGGADWAWRNRKEILQWIMNRLRTKQRRK